MSRRLGYYHHIINRNEHELIRKGDEAQKRKPAKDDWVNSIKNDKILLEIDEDDNKYKTIKPKKFKSKIKIKIREKTFNYLKEKQMNHSKVKEIKYETFKQQKYMSNYSFTQNDIDLLFKLRTNMIDVKMNFKGMYEKYSCDLCQKDVPQTQVHLTQCEAIINNCSMLFENIDAEYEDIYGKPEKQLKIVRLFRSILQTKEKMLEVES